MLPTTVNSSQQAGDPKALSKLAEQILAQAQQQGATAAEVVASDDVGFGVSARMGEVETVEYNHDKGVGITVYFGQQKGSASTTDTNEASVKNAIEAACNFARFGGIDNYAGLADKDRMAFDYPDLDLCHPWNIDTEQAIAMSIACEKHGLDFDKRIKNSDGATVSTNHATRVYANSHGFVGAYQATRHNISCVLIAEEKSLMERDYDYTVSRDPHDLEAANKVALSAAKRTVARLGARKLTTRKAPILFAPEVAKGLLSSFIGAISGSSLYRQASFLLDHLGKSVFPKNIHIYEQPHLAKALGSAPFDSEGVATTNRDIVKDGILQSYVLSSYSARKLGMQTTGNAGGVHNLTIDSNNLDFNGLLKQMGTGLLVTEVMGQGVNIITGDYSRGASGFWVDNGEIQYPVHEITIAGNLKDMFQHIIAVGNDIDLRGNIRTGSILIEKMMIAGE